MNLKMEVYNEDLELIGILETYSSLLIEDWSFEAGSFSLESILNEETRPLLVPDNIIWFGDKIAGRIEYVYGQNTNLVTITIKGGLLKGILDTRILWGLYNLKGSAPELMYQLVEDNAVSPTRGNPEKRKIPNLTLKPVPQDSRIIRIQKTGGSLLEALSDMGSSQQVFFDVEFNPKILKMEFVTRVGVNRTIHQNDVEQVFFGTELDDILESSYTYNSQDYKNSALVAGEGEGSERKLLEVLKGGEEDHSGLQRRELWIDARDLQAHSTLEEEELTPEEYEGVLKTRGEEKLSERQLVQSFDANMRTKDPTYVFGKDFFLGDTITAIDKKLGITVDALVEGVEYSYVDGVESLTLTLGYSSPTIYDRLRKEGM